MLHDTLDTIKVALSHLNSGGYSSTRKILSELTERLERDMATNAVIIWTPEDFEDLELGGSTPEEALASVKKSLEDCTQGWDIIYSSFSPKQGDEE